MFVYINEIHNYNQRRQIRADLVAENKRTVLVRLWNGKIIKRKKRRDLP